MAKSFDKIPSEILIVREHEEPTVASVADELRFGRTLLQQRKNKCKPIRPVYKVYKKRGSKWVTKFYCVCPQYSPAYLCKHSGNIIIDRDVLTKDEHICYLATPKENFAAKRKQPRFYQRRTIVPSCTSRIVQLAKPKLIRVEENLITFKKFLSRKHYQHLSQHLERKSEINYTSINSALNYLEEERRLKRVASLTFQRRCKRLKKNIRRKQRRQIRKIICVIFEEMKDFLLNDQFLIDERSTLCTVILEQVRRFTDKEFYTTTNLREYQHILANNLTVWVNKFVANLNIHMAEPQVKLDHPENEPFLPIKDYIPYSESVEEEINLREEFEKYETEDMMYGEFDLEAPTDETLTNPNANP